jgi:uncharacterized caspase-like protein
MSRSIFVAALWFTASLGQQFSEGADRVALVIGNSNYGGEAALRSPSNDADAMEAALQGLGFTVIKRKNLELAQMEDALGEFRRALTKGSLGLFYYAGDGMEVNGKNFLVPIGAKLQEERDAIRQCLLVDRLMDAMAESQSDLKVVVLDCGRENPFKQSWKRSGSGGVQPAMTEFPEDTMLAFATSPNKPARDGAVDHSPFTKHLVTALQSRPSGGLELLYVFRTALSALKRETGQTAWLNFSPSLETHYLWQKSSARPPEPAGTTGAQRDQK